MGLARAAAAIRETYNFIPMLTIGGGDGPASMLVDPTAYRGGGGGSDIAVGKGMVVNNTGAPINGLTVSLKKVGTAGGTPSFANASIGGGTAGAIGLDNGSVAHITGLKLATGSPPPAFELTISGIDMNECESAAVTLTSCADMAVDEAEVPLLIADICALPDIDGDGWEEVLVGAGSWKTAPGWWAVYSGRSGQSISKGPAGDQIRLRLCALPGIGWAVSSYGEVEDGSVLILRPDGTAQPVAAQGNYRRHLFGSSLASTKTDEGGVLLFVGGSREAERGDSLFIFDAATGQRVGELIPEERFAFDASFGAAVASNGTFVAVAAPGAERIVDEQEQGGAVVMFDLRSRTQVAEIWPSWLEFLFGQALAFIADEDGDGLDELVVGAWHWGIMTYGSSSGWSQTWTMQNECPHGVWNGVGYMLSVNSTGHLLAVSDCEAEPAGASILDPGTHGVTVIDTRTGEKVRRLSRDGQVLARWLRGPEQEYLVTAYPENGKLSLSSGDKELWSRSTP